MPTSETQKYIENVKVHYPAMIVSVILQIISNEVFFFYFDEVYLHVRMYVLFLSNTLSLN